MVQSDNLAIEFGILVAMVFAIPVLLVGSILLEQGSRLHIRHIKKQALPRLQTDFSSSRHKVGLLPRLLFRLAYRLSRA
jgi:hypothetical protein